MNVAAAGECGAVMADTKENFVLRSMLGWFRACRKEERELGGAMSNRIPSFKR